MPSMLLPITALYAGVHGLTLIALAIHVVRHRARTKVLYSDGGDERLARAIRVHGNFCEHVPFALILIGILELGGVPGWALHALGAVLFAARLMHAHALICQSFATRLVSVTATWVVIAVAAVWSILIFARTGI